MISTKYSYTDPLQSCAGQESSSFRKMSESRRNNIDSNNDVSALGWHDQQAAEGNKVQIYKGREDGTQAQLNRQEDTPLDESTTKDTTTPQKPAIMKLQQQEMPNFGQKNVWPPNLDEGTFGRKKTSLAYRYVTPDVKNNNGFVVPPVFPKTCSLYDSNFNGGAFADRREDRKLVEAIDRMRKKHSKDSTDSEVQFSTNTTNNDDPADLSDSGNSSLTDGHPSPLTSPGFDPNPMNNTTNEITVSHRNTVLFQNDSMKSSHHHHRLHFFRRRVKSNSAKKGAAETTIAGKNVEGDNDENYNQPPHKHWTIGATKGISWKAKLLRTLSAGSPGLAENESKNKGKGQKGEKPSSHYGNLNREWEFVGVRELCRRLSLEDSLEPSEMPLPEGAIQSQLLDEFMIRQIIGILPPRAEGYPWVQLYNSEKHGFSLSTLYRKMSEWNEEVSPVLLVVRDVQGHVFGAVASTALKPSDHYYGTGDSSLLFRFTGEFPHTRELRTFTWTGDNQFFVNATKDFLSFGAGGGHYGLWLDADLNHGRSQKCATFDNEPLAGGQDEDFVVQFVEVFGFSMS